ncbi:PulJ/GspJ family protein [Deinococcus budaensis]|uniref:Prepilin-type N-terminal cleavage/methylation domain-containing protein n=1 Tax=Deinococcus budaensis TaxID=1665626 RepID=A0A7W8GEH3_9DEIO|nr:prepilin-type N-terminal cleavage/methylation domain-containing protein [Deinococcus budaensis]MBB5233828.1 prepilin-type N-terminal cleavage/methylation domain-containing protein [Deinococcus budaensis]
MQAERGLTLIEVLVAIAMFAVVSVTVLAMFPTIFKLNSQTRADQAVTIGAKQYLESARPSFLTPTTFDAATTTSLAAAPSGTSVNNYTCEREVANVQTTPAGVVIIKRLTLRCTHTSQPTQTFTLDFGRPL